MGRERQIDGLVGKVWEINDPETISVGHCFMAGRLKKGDLCLCTEHSGDCFQDYIFVKRLTEYRDEPANLLQGLPKINFGSYGIGDSREVTEIELSREDVFALRAGFKVKLGTNEGEGDLGPCLPNGEDES